MNKRTEEILRRQAVLAEKLLKGEADDNEKTELAQITAALTEALKPPVFTMKTALKIMKLSDVHAWLKKVTDMDPPDRELLAIAKRNIEQIKAQGVTDAEAAVAVEMPLPETEEDRFAKLEARIVELELGWDKRTHTGVNTKPKRKPSADQEPEPDAEEDEPEETTGEPAEKQQTAEEKSMVQILSMEIMDSLIAKLTSLKEKIAAGPVTCAEIEAAWPGYGVQSLISTMGTMFAKYDAVKSMFDSLRPELEKLVVPAEKVPAADPAKDKDDDKDDAKDDDADDDKGGADKEETQKGSDAVARFNSGLDLAPRSAGGAADLKLVRQGIKKGRQPGSAYRGNQ